jgi:hypothetical protein
MHKLRINISVKPKLMINSQDVYFYITRQCAQVELKNINILSEKNNLGSFYDFLRNLQESGNCKYY